MKKFCWIIKLAKKEEKRKQHQTTLIEGALLPVVVPYVQESPQQWSASYILHELSHGGAAVTFSGEVDGDEVKDGSLSIKVFFLPATKSGQNRTRKRFATQNMEFCFPTQRRRVVTREEIVRVYGNDGVTLLVTHIWQNISSRQRAKNKPFCVSLRRKQINLTPVCQQCLSRLGVMKSK